MGNSIYCYRRLNQLSELVREISSILQSMSRSISTAADRQTSTDENYKTLHKYVTDEIEELRGQLPSIEC